jgi:hypothetical protein
MYLKNPAEAGFFVLPLFQRILIVFMPSPCEAVSLKLDLHVDGQVV